VQRVGSADGCEAADCYCVVYSVADRDTFGNSHATLVYTAQTIQDSQVSIRTSCYRCANRHATLCRPSLKLADGATTISEATAWLHDIIVTPRSIDSGRRSSAVAVEPAPTPPVYSSATRLTLYDNDRFNSTVWASR